LPQHHSQTDILLSGSEIHLTTHGGLLLRRGACGHPRFGADANRPDETGQFPANGSDDLILFFPRAASFL
jgi:hypothetical protein